MTQFIIIAKPETSGQFQRNHPGLEPVLIFSRPNAVLIERQFVIDTKRTAASTRTLRPQRDGRRSGELYQGTDERCERAIEVWHPGTYSLCVTKYTEWWPACNCG